jgi:poly(3-hydroxybutyrate) depolymerase
MTTVISWPFFGTSCTVIQSTLNVSTSLVFSSGSEMVQLLAARHSKSITAIVAVATPLTEPPVKLAHSMPVLCIHGDNDEQFSCFEVNRPNSAQ